MKVHPKITMCNIWWERARDEVEAFIVRGAVNALVDTGPVEAFASPLSRSLEDLDLAFGDIDLILNTHWHPDHTGGNVPIKAAGNARVFIHRDDALYLKDPCLGFDRYRAPVINELLGPECLMQERAAVAEAGGGAPADRHLEDDDVIEIGQGVAFRVIHLPGHSPGSVGFYWEQEAVLFTGDSLPGLHVDDGKLPLIFDFPAYEKSLKRLMGMPLQLLLCGHPFRGVTLAPSPVRRGRDIGEYLHDCLEVAERIGEAVGRVTSREGQLPLLQAVDRVVAELPERMRFRMTADLASPLFSGSTVYWYRRQLLRKGR